ncbi:MAG: ATP-binding protein [Synergistaceae bacterium]
MKYNIPELRFTLINELSCLKTVTHAVKSLNDRWNIPESQIINLRLAIEEALVNVISYAYPPGETGEIELSMMKIDGSIVIDISDQGVAFDPTQVADVDISASAEERGIGGLGIHMLKILMDEVIYTRQGEFNRLTLKKKIEWK